MQHYEKLKRERDAEATNKNKDKDKDKDKGEMEASMLTAVPAASEKANGVYEWSLFALEQGMQDESGGASEEEPSEPKGSN